MGGRGIKKNIESRRTNLECGGFFVDIFIWKVHFVLIESERKIVSAYSICYNLKTYEKNL